MNDICRKTLALLLLASLATAQYPGAKPVPEELRAGFDDIEAQSCRSWLEVIASDEMKGRKTGTPGYEKAAAYVAARFEEFGLKPIGDDGGYFQQVPLYRLRAGGDGPEVEIGDEVFTGDDLQQLLCNGDVEAEAVAILAGDKAEFSKSQDVSGKVVFLNCHRSVLKAPLYRQIREMRPAALVLMKGTPGVLDRVSPGQLAQEWNAKTPTLVVEDEAYRAMLKAAGLRRSFGGKAPRNGLKIAKARLPVHVRATATEDKIVAPNVIGMLEGSDAKLRSEYVICGSHLDHIGVGRDGQIHNGADDDGSGTTSLLAVARAFSRTEDRPKRSLIFIAVCGEEDGLLGSEYYVENPIVPIEDTICELQMDMVGRNEEGKGDKPERNLKTTHLVGTKKLSMDLHKLILKMNRHVGFDFEYDEEGVWNRSDHYNFAKKGIPIAFVFSGFHPDYHKPTDTIDKINFEKIANTAKLIYLTAYAAADRSKRIVVDKKRR